MCTPLAALAITAIAGGASYIGSRQQSQAMNEAAGAENLRQQQMQARQAQLIANQESDKERGRKAFQELQPQFTKEAVGEDEAAARAAREASYDQAVRGPMQPVQQGADATQAASADVTITPTTNLAVRNAMTGEKEKALAFSGDRAKAQAFLDALGDAQLAGQQRLRRGAEQIGMYGDFVSGANRPMNALEQLKAQSGNLYQSHLNKAMGKGAAWRGAGQLLGTMGQMAYGKATS